MDRHDRALLATLRTHGRVPFFPRRPSQEARLRELVERGYAFREWTTFRVTRQFEDMRWAYRITKEGEAVLDSCYGQQIS